jgi:hypothetical protein
MENKEINDYHVIDLTELSAALPLIQQQEELHTIVDLPVSTLPELKQIKEFPCGKCPASMRFILNSAWEVTCSHCLIDIEDNPRYTCTTEDQHDDDDYFDLCLNCVVKHFDVKDVRMFN